MELRRRIIFAMLLLVVVTSLSVLGYRLLGGPSISFLQALYMAVIDPFRRLVVYPAMLGDLEKAWARAYAEP